MNFTSRLEGNWTEDGLGLTISGVSVSQNCSLGDDTSSSSDFKLSFLSLPVWRIS
jgi:hypothetical protein